MVSSKTERISPMMPTIIRITPMVPTLNPLVLWSYTAKRRIAPAAMTIRLVASPPVPISAPHQLAAPASDGVADVRLYSIASALHHYLPGAGKAADRHLHGAGEALPGIAEPACDLHGVLLTVWVLPVRDDVQTLMTPRVGGCPSVWWPGLWPGLWPGPCVRPPCGALPCGRWRCGVVPYARHPRGRRPCEAP